MIGCSSFKETVLDFYNIDGNRDLAGVFMKLLDEYIRCLETRSLPNYFIRFVGKLSSVNYSVDHRACLSLK